MFRARNSSPTPISSNGATTEVRFMGLPYLGLRVAGAGPLHQLKQTENDQQDGPGAAEADAAEVVDRQKHAERDQHDRAANGAQKTGGHCTPPFLVELESDMRR